MNQLNQFLTAYAEPVLFLALFAEQLGLPLPAAPILVAAGALAADGALNPGLAVGITIVACVLADMIWFYVGRRGGAGLLRFLCKLALRDASSFERTERLFARHGMTAVAAAKFVPGLGLLMPPMAGAFGIDLRRFLRFDALGSFLYVTFYLELGVLFSNEVNGLLKLISRFGVASATLAFALVMIFVAYKYVRRRKASKRSPDAPAIRVGSPVPRGPNC